MGDDLQRTAVSAGFHRPRMRMCARNTFSCVESVDSYRLPFPPPPQQFFYVLLDGALPPTPDPLSGTTAVKVIIDQFIQAPVFTVIIFGVRFYSNRNYGLLVCDHGRCDHVATMMLS